MRRRLWVAVVGGSLVAQAATGLIMAPAALAADKLGQVTECPIPTASSNPTKLVTGPDGNIWFAEAAANKIGKVTTSCAVTEFALPYTTNVEPLDITVGSDGNLWFTESMGNRIGKMTTSGVLTEFPVPTAGQLDQITAGPDGNLWFTEFTANKIGKITTAGVITEYVVPTAGGMTLDGGVGPGPDGNVWFTEGSGNKIGVITPGGLITEFPIPTASSQPASIVPGPDGNMWFTEYNASKIGRILVSGAHTINEFPTATANSLPNDLHAMPDGNIWFSDAPNGQVKIARITTAGTIAEFAIPTANSQPSGVTPGPDGNVWFSEYNASKIARIGTVPSPDLIGQVTEYPIPTAASSSNELIAGPDGNLWFNEYAGNKIGKVTTAGTFTEFALPNANSQPQSIAAGADGNLWFTEASGNRIGRITTGGTITEFTTGLTASSQPDDITAGPDGNIWFAEALGNKIGKITPTGTITEYTVPTTGGLANGANIGAGPDGNLWFAEGSGNKIGRITPAGVITEFPVPTAASRPNKIEPGPDGNVWFTEYSANKIGRILVGGGNTITEYTVPTAASGPNDLRAGPDGTMWFTETNPNINKVARITMTGTIAEFNVPTANSQPGGIAPGPDGNMWFTENSGNKIARMGVVRSQTAESLQQYTLTGNDGAAWQTIDPVALSVTLTPKTNSVVVLSGNADLWTSMKGVNQDLGIRISGGIYQTPGPVVAWKESGGFAGTFSPNAAFVQTIMPLTVGATYTATLVWKANKPTAGTIYAAAGNGPTYSPTRLTAEMIPNTDLDLQTAVSTQQYALAGNDGAAWQDMDDTGLLTINFTPAASGPAVINANADLWTSLAHVNQDIGIFISGGSFGSGRVVGWKESGGNAGTFSPNAADAQTVVQLTGGTPYTIKLQWKTNVRTSGTIYAAAGGAGNYSPTRLTLRLVPVGTLVTDAVSTQQYFRIGSTGADWMPIDVPNLQMTVTPTADSQWMLSGNVDLWTATAGVNQDVGIFVSGGAYGTGTLVAWKESGGFAGTFSPNAAFVHTVLPLAGGMTYTVTLEWKANKSTGGTIYAGAGGPIYSPTRLTMQSMG